MSGVNYGNTTATTLVTISVSDVNDNTPTFNHLNYTATIQENMQSGVPVIFTANTIMSVNDIDQVSHPSGVTATYQIKYLDSVRDRCFQGIMKNKFIWWKIYNCQQMRICIDE